MFTQTAEPLVLAAAVSAAGLVLFVLATYGRTVELLEWCLGFTAGLQGAQVAKVHVFTIVAVAYVFFGARSSPGRSSRVVVLIIAVACLIASAPLGTLVNDKTLALQVVALAFGAAVIATRATGASARRMLFGLLAAAVLGSLVAVAQKGGLLPYTPALDASGIPRVRGLYHEPDWLGLYSAVGLILLFFLPLRRYVQVACGACLVTGNILSGARASWLSLAIVAVLALVIQGIRRDPRWLALRNGRMLLLGAGLLLAAALLSPGIVSIVTQRLAHTDQTQVSILARQAQDRTLEMLARSAPWHGYGLSASGHVQVNGLLLPGPSPNNVATNWILGWWVDAKYLSLPIIALFIVFAITSLGDVSGLLLTAVLIDSLFANLVLNPIVWFLLGLAMAARRSTESSSPVGVRGRAGPQLASGGHVPDPAS